MWHTTLHWIVLFSLSKCEANRKRPCYYQWINLYSSNKRCVTYFPIIPIQMVGVKTYETHLFIVWWLDLYLVAGSYLRAICCMGCGTEKLFSHWFDLIICADSNFNTSVLIFVLFFNQVPHQYKTLKKDVQKHINHQLFGVYRSMILFCITYKFYWKTL